MNIAVQASPPKPPARFIIGNDLRLYVFTHRNEMWKARRDISKLVPRLVIDKNGHRRTVYVRLGLPVKKPVESGKVENKTLNTDEKTEVKKFILGNPIISVKTGIIKADENGTAIQNARKWAKDHAREIFRPDIGKIVFDASGVRDSLSHRFGKRKLDAVQAIPAAIEKGKIVSISDDLDGKPIKNVILVAPIQIEETKSFLCVRLVKNIGNDNRLRVHEVFDLGDIKNTAIPFQTPGTDLTARPQRGIAIYLNILRDILNVNGKQ
jgi:hypothetical protein